MDAPAIADTDGIRMNILFDNRRSMPLWVELTSCNIAYLRSACLSEIESGVVKRAKPVKKVVEACSETATHEQESDSSSVHDVDDQQSESEQDPVSDLESDTPACENVVADSVSNHETFPTNSHDQLIKMVTPFAPKRQTSISSFFRAS